ncbi:hypothetical protein ACCO45_000200 [Purpureocillium lilacinum]|uniref:Uncharacterized protein n=1 Tax=Purpureocillium lilacinum TaxID=33203 RepID=A0ACC4E3H3_PURLI
MSWSRPQRWSVGDATNSNSIATTGDCDGTARSPPGTGSEGFQVAKRADDEAKRQYGLQALSRLDRARSLDTPQAWFDALPTAVLRTASKCRRLLHSAFVLSGPNAHSFSSPPPPPPAFESVAPRPTPRPPTVPPDGPAGAFQVQLFVFNASPFKDHWAYFVRSNARHTQGVVLHATGDVNNGFRLEFKRLHDLDTADEVPSEIIPLQWVDAQYFDESAMLNNGNPVIDTVPACAFEVSACKVKAPGKSLNSASTNVGASIALADAFGVPLSNAEPRKKVVQRNCQTWIVESADQLVADGIFSREVAAFLHASEQ